MSPTISWGLVIDLSGALEGRNIGPMLHQLCLREGADSR